MWSRDVVVMANKKVKVDYISSEKWDFDMNGFLGFWNEESEWIYHREIDFLRGFFRRQVVWQMAKNDYWHVAMRLDFGNIGLYMVCT